MSTATMAGVAAMVAVMMPTPEARTRPDTSWTHCGRHDVVYRSLRG
jgi:hypothetical protein